MDGSTAPLPEARTAAVLGPLRRVWRPAAVAAAALVLAVGALALTRSDLFLVRQIDVDGESRLSEREVLRQAGISLRDNAVWFDDAAAERRLASDPWVESADVRIDLPWTVTVTVTERSAVGVVDRAGTATLVAADGTNLGTPARRANLPTIVAPPPWVGWAGGISVTEVAAALGAMEPDLRAEVRRVTLGPSGIELVLKDGVRVVYGDAAQAGAKAAALEEVLRWVEGPGPRVRVVNVAAPSAPTVVPVA